MRWVGVLVAASGVVLAPVTVAHAENVLRWVTAVPVANWEPTNNEWQSENGLSQVFEGLTRTDADLSLHPSLATSWALVRPDLWRFTLREHVRFHDGTAFTPEDVVFSLNRARAGTSESAYYAKTIVAVAAVDEHTVEITTERPELRLPVQLRRLYIMSRAWARQHGALLPPQRDDASAYVFAHANGTGAFVLENVDQGGRTLLTRNADWWGLEQNPHNIDRIIWTVEPDAEPRLALLGSGQLDFLQDLPLDRLDGVRAVPGFKVVQANSLLTWFLGPDESSRELRTSDIKDRNPFADRRVRQALYQAIDIEKLIKAVGGLGVPAGMVEAPGVNGYDPELDRRLPYDPARAKALLAEAGYPAGFAVRLDCGNINVRRSLEIAAQLAEVGMRITVNPEPSNVYKSRLAARETDLYPDSEASGITFDSAEPLRELFHSSHPYWGGATGYVNPTLDALLDQIDGEISTIARDALIEQAWRIVLDDIAVIPLYHAVNIWAMRDNLDLPIGPYNVPVFRQARITGPPAH